MIGYGNSMFLATHGILARTASGGGVDPDAQAFITAAGITNPTQQSAINQLVVDLKGYGIWSKLGACYPMIGGSATAHSYNLKNPSQYQITWFGGATHSANGVGFNGTNSYGNTGYNQTTAGDTVNSAHLSYYSRTNSNATEVEIGVQHPASNYNLLEIRTSGTTYFLQNQSALTIVSDSDSRGFYLGNRQASNDIDGWRNGIKLINGTTASNSLPNANIFIGAFNSLGAASLYTTKQCAFASIGSGLTDTEAANFRTAVQAFQVTLGRSIGTQTVSDADE